MKFLCPPGCGGASVAGNWYGASEGIVEAPEQYAEALFSHGFTVAPSRPVEADYPKFYAMNVAELRSFMAGSNLDVNIDGLEGITAKRNAVKAAFEDKVKRG